MHEIFCSANVPPILDEDGTIRAYAVRMRLSLGPIVLVLLVAGCGGVETQGSSPASNDLLGGGKADKISRGPTARTTLGRLAVGDAVNIEGSKRLFRACRERGTAYNRRAVHPARGLPARH